MAGYEEVNNVLIETEPEDSHFVEEHGDHVACVIQKVHYTQKIPDTTQKHQIFYSRCSVKDYITYGSLEARDKAISSSLQHWVDQEMSMHQGNGSMLYSYFY